MIDPNKITWYKNGLKVRLKNRSIGIYESSDGKSMIVQFRSFCKDKECANKPAILHSVERGHIKVSDLKLSHEALSTLGVMAKSFFVYKRDEYIKSLEPDNIKEEILKSVGVPEKYLGSNIKENVRDTIHNLISRVDKGEEMFATDPVFRNCIEGIARGADPIKVLANICEMMNNQNKAFIEHMKICKGVEKIPALMSDNEG